MHRSGNVVWAMAKCKVCREVGKHLLADVMNGPVACRHCRHRMDIKGATVEAVEATEARLEDGSQYGESAAAD